MKKNFCKILITSFFLTVSALVLIDYLEIINHTSLPGIAYDQPFDIDYKGYPEIFYEKTTFFKNCAVKCEIDYQYTHFRWGMLVYNFVYLNLIFIPMLMVPFLFSVLYRRIFK